MPESAVTLVDGQIDFSGGVDSLKVTSIATEANPQGLARNQLAWLNNATVRGGGITQRNGWQPICTILNPGALYQGGYLYEPSNGDPYHILLIGGVTYKVEANGTVTNLTALFPGTAMPATEPIAFFCQGEQFLVIQAGDYTTLPLFWDGTTLRRSLGAQTVVNITAANFTVPAQYGWVNVTLTAPYSGVTNELFTIGGYHYMQIVGNNFLTIKNLSVPPGNVIPAGTDIYDTGGTVYQTTTLLPFVVPAIGSKVQVWVSPLYTGAANCQIYDEDWTATLPAGHANAGVNHVLLVNIDDTPGKVVAAPANLLSPAELPAAGPMDYYMGRLWYAQGRQYTAGDIVNGPSGTVPYNFRDSILKVTENPLAIGGDGFIVPDNAGNIRALFHNANLNTQLGQGQLFIGTRRAVYSLEVPVSRNDWISANASNIPVQRVAQLVNGPVNDRSCAKVNGDVFFQSLEPGIRSLFVSVRNFQQWGNTALSAQLQRLLAFNDRALLRYGSGISFNNRLFQTALPAQTDYGVVHKALASLDFLPLSTFLQDTAPVWEGMYQGVNIMQMFCSDFGGRERAFAVVLAQDNSIALWEFTDTKTDNGDNRVTWQVEFPAYNWGREFDLKKLVSAELWIDRLWGDVIFTLEWRPDGDACWHLWHKWQLCSARNSCEDVHNPVCYPVTPYGEGFRQTVTLPRPPEVCQTNSGRPAHIGYQFQCRLTVHGFCRLRGFILHAEKVDRKLYASPVC